MGFENFDKTLLKTIEERFSRSDSGKEIVYKERKYESVSTGSDIIDLCISPDRNGAIGFLIKGKISEVSGMESSGKSTLVYQCLANAVKKKWVVALIDSEGSFDPLYAKALGLVEGKYFRVFRPTVGEDVDKLVNMLTGNGKGYKKTALKIDAIVFDSVASIRPRELLEMDDSTGSGSSKGVHARFWTNFVTKLNKLAVEKKIAFGLVNQIRYKINMDSVYQEKSIQNNSLASGYNSDNSRTTTGGEAIKFYASLRLLLQQAKRPKLEKMVNNQKVETKDTLTYTKITVIKNKVDIPFMKAVTAIQFGKGYNDFLPMFDYLKDEAKMITSSTSGVYTFKFEDVEVSIKGVANFQRELYLKHREDMVRAYKDHKATTFKQMYDKDDILEDLLDKDSDEDVLIYDEEDTKEHKPKTRAKRKTKGYSRKSKK